MQSRFTAHGLNSENKEVVLAFELLEDAVQVNLHIVPKQTLSAEQSQQLQKEWVNGGAFEFSAETVLTNPDLNGDSILPDDIKSEETGLIRSKQNEWAYRLLTNKLWEVYLVELASLKQKAAELTSYSRTLFDDAKSFWERVLAHKKDRDISQSKLDEIKEEVNGIFETLKELRKKESSEFEENSSAFKNDLVAKIEAIKSRMVEGVVFKELHEELKQLQTTLRGGIRFTKADETTIRKTFDGAFQQLHEAFNSFANNKNASRIENLTKIVGNIEKSLQYDKNDLAYFTKKISHPKANALEIQLAKLKLKMLEEQIASKEAKVADINKTLEKLKAPKRKTSNIGKAKEETASTTTENAEVEEILDEEKNEAVAEETTSTESTTQQTETEDTTNKQE